MIHNYTETLISDLLQAEYKDHVEKYLDVCKCPACQSYIKAIALNILPPYYYTSLAGKVFGEYGSKDQQNRSDILVAIGRGMEELMRLDPYGHCTHPQSILSAL